MSRWIFPRIIAHRGGGNAAPENTLAGIAFGLSQGYKAIEIDVMLTKDKIPILMHDEFTGRTIQIPTKEKVMIADLDWDELNGLDAGSWFSPSFQNVNIPLFSEVLKYCFDNQIWINIEIKPCPGFEKLTGEIVARETAIFYDRYSGLRDEQSPLFSSFSFDSLKEARRIAPHIKRGLLIDKLDETPNWMVQCRDIEAFSIHVNHNDITPEFLSSAKSIGLGIFCYTVNNTERAKFLIEAGVDSFCTDQLQDFLNFL